MAIPNAPQNGKATQWVTVHADPSGQYTAQVVGLPEIAATGPNRDDAVQRVRATLGDLLATGKLVPIEVEPSTSLLEWFGHADPNDPDEQAYLEELRRLRQEDLEQTLKELDAGCPNSSSTPTT